MANAILKGTFLIPNNRPHNKYCSIQYVMCVYITHSERSKLSLKLIFKLYVQLYIYIWIFIIPRMWWYARYNNERTFLWLSSNCSSNCIIYAAAVGLGRTYIPDDVIAIVHTKLPVWKNVIDWLTMTSELVRWNMSSIMFVHLFMGLLHSPPGFSAEGWKIIRHMMGRVLPKTSETN